MQQIQNNFPQLYRYVIALTSLFGSTYICDQQFWKTEEQTYGTEILTAVTMKITIFWDITICSLVQVNFYQTTWSYIQNIVMCTL
jgi:hypothetical protein